MTSYRCARLAVVAVTLAMQAVVAAIGASTADVNYFYFVHSRADTVSADGVCTLREAIHAAENAPRNGDCGFGSPEPGRPGNGEVDIIFIDVAGTIVLEHGALPEITGKMAIFGSYDPEGGTTIDANGRARPFWISSTADVTLEELTITNGKAPNGSLASPRGGDGGAIHNRGRLRLTDVRITHSAAGNGGVTVTGEGGHGGAIYNTGTIVGYRVTFDENHAGESGPIDIVLGGFGGAIFNDFNGSITLYAATFTGNAQGRFGQGATVFNRGVSNIRSSTFMRNGIPGLLHETASLATDGGGVVTLSSTIMADRPGCVTFGPSYFIDFGFNLGLVDQPGAGTCAFTSVSRSIVDSSGQPVLDSELRNNGGFVPTLALIQPSLAIDRVAEWFEDCAPGKLPILDEFVLTDARGVDRGLNGNCDIGAFEIGPSFRIGVRTLAITGAGTGQGTVSGGGLECAIAAGAPSGQCSAEYGPGTVVTPTATAAAGSIFVGWAGDPECADGSVLMDGDKHCAAIFDLRAFSVTGSANGIGDVRPPKSQGRAEVTFDAAFAVAGAIDLGSATVTIHALVNEEGASGAGELVEGLPIVLQALPGGGSTAAIFETPASAPTRVTVEVQIAQSSPSTVAIAIEAATIARFPALCATATPPATTLTTRFTIDDGVNPPLTVTARDPWRCLAPTGGDRLQPRLLRTQ